jgi:LysM repeat protein
MVRTVSRTAAAATGVVALFLSGCASRPKPGLLGPRAVVPPPFVEPAATGPVTSLPAEPVFTPPAPVATGAVIDDSLFTPAEGTGLPAKAETAKPGKVESARMSYTVKKGDSLWLISQMYGVSVGELAAENGIAEGSVLRIGQVLKLPPGATGHPKDPAEIKRTAVKRAAPAPRPKAATPAKAGTAAAPKAPAAGAGATTRRSTTKEPIPADGIYTVKSDDNPWTIARKFGVKHEDLMQWNNYKSDTVLQIGQKVKLRADAAEGIADATKVSAPAPEAVPAPGAVLPEHTPVTAPGTTPPAAGIGPAETGTTPAPEAGTTPPAGAVGAPAEGTVTPPAGTGTAPATPGALDLPKKLSHTVTEGDTLEIIAEMYGTKVEEIKKENPTIKSNADLLPNTKLMVPYR